MMSAKLTPIRVEAVFWLILCLGLAAGIGLEADWSRQVRPPLTQFAKTPPPFPEPVLVEPFRLPPPDQVLHITARPIFVATRRPVPIAPSSEAANSRMKKDQYILMGTTIVPGAKFAFLLEKAGNKSRVVGEGKTINGIMVRKVTAERVVLSQYDETEVLVLKMNRPLSGAPGVGGVARDASAAPPGGATDARSPPARRPAISGAQQ